MLSQKVTFISDENVIDGRPKSDINLGGGQLHEIFSRAKLGRNSAKEHSVLPAKEDYIALPFSLIGLNLNSCKHWLIILKVANVSGPLVNIKSDL